LRLPLAAGAPLLLLLLLLPPAAVLLLLAAAVPACPDLPKPMTAPEGLRVMSKL
jgi:hypothetical protein